MADNELYFGDNIDVLPQHIEDESVDLVYLDPPFKSDQDYNVLFEQKDGTAAEAQIEAFEDTWQWDVTAARAFEDVVEEGGAVADCLVGLRKVLGESDMLAYLSMMAPRLKELRRVLKDSGSIFLHCDSTASHYLKALMDGVFGAENFRNEIVWERSTPKGLMSKKLPTNHDIILAYSKTEDVGWNEDAMYKPYDPDNLPESVDEKYSREDEDGRRYQLTSLLNPNKDRPNLEYEFLGVTRVWRWTEERMRKAYEEGRVVQTAPGNVPRQKRYLEEQKGMPIGDVWTDISPINARAEERLHYPTQKPVELLERIIELCTDEGDVVLDPFCGCGTTIAASQKLDRKWIGIDITHLAINLIKHRLQDMFSPEVSNEYEVTGEPTTVAAAEKLAENDRYQFEFWALGLVGARPKEENRGADQGVDGRLYFHDDNSGETKQIVISVKSGRTEPTHVRDLRGVMEQEEAEIGVFITLQEPTQNMIEVATSAGFYESPWGKHPRVQIITVEELLNGEEIDYPPARQVNKTFKRAPRVEETAEQLDLTD